MNEKFHDETEIIEIARYIIKTKKTLRDAANYFKLSRSTVHYRMIRILPRINKNLHNEIRKVFDSNIKVRHIRGGESTRKYYLKIKECNYGE